MAEDTHIINTVKEQIKKESPMTRVSETNGTDASKYPTNNRKKNGKKNRVEAKKFK